MACSYARAYKHYTKDTLKTAVNQIVSKKMSLRKASRHFGIPTGTLSNRLNKKHNKKPGHPPVFTDEEEKSFVKHIQVVGEWGFPFDNFDIRILAKNYLASKGLFYTSKELKVTFSAGIGSEEDILIKA